jgi:hypothetical protein
MGNFKLPYNFNSPVTYTLHAFFNTRFSRLFVTDECMHNNYLSSPIDKINERIQSYKASESRQLLFNSSHSFKIMNQHRKKFNIVLLIDVMKYF